MKRILFFSLLLLLLASCARSRYHDRLLLAEEQVTRSADSCAHLLEGIPVEELDTEDRALHGLLSSWLLYRQYAKEIPAEPLDAAFDYYHESRDPLRRAQVYFLRSVINEDQKRGTTAQWMEDLYSACLAIEQTDDYLLASQIYQNYANMFTNVQQFDDARIWIDKFAETAYRSGNMREYVHALITKSSNSLYAEDQRLKKQLGTRDGAAIARHTQFTEAFDTIYKALSIAQEQRMEVELGRIYTQLAIYHSRCQHIDSLVYYSRLSVLLNERLFAQGKRKQVTNYLTLCDAFRKQGAADSAIYYARKTLGTPGTPMRNKQAAAQMLYNIYSDLKGDYKTSMEWMRVYNLYTDSVNHLTVASNIEAVQDAAVKEQEKTVLREEKQHAIGWAVWSALFALLAVLSISLLLIYNRRRYRKLLKAQEEEFNRMLQKVDTPPVLTAVQEPAEPEPAPALDPVTEVPASSTLLLTGTTRDQIQVNPSSILFLTSESNYVKVLLLDESGKVQSKMIRQTMSSIETQLNAYPHIVRCHRAFIVNLQHVRHASSSSSGLQLSLDATNLTVPVSKTYLSLIKERIK